MGRGRKRGRSQGESPRLFAHGDMMLRPTGLARLRALAQGPTPSPTARERMLEENRRTMRKLRAWGRELGRRFGLQFKALEQEREGVNGHFGICYEDGVIRIRLRHATTGRLLKESSLVDTLCHELAHLRYMDHSLRFRRLYLRILDAARDSGYYRPGPQENTAPRQLSLFEAGRCGTLSAAAAEDGVCNPSSTKPSDIFPGA